MHQKATKYFRAVLMQAILIIPSLTSYQLMINYFTKYRRNNLNIKAPEQWAIWIGPAQQAVSGNLCNPAPCRLIISKIINIPTMMMVIVMMRIMRIQRLVCCLIVINILIWGKISYLQSKSFFLSSLPLRSVEKNEYNI